MAGPPAAVYYGPSPSRIASLASQYQPALDNYGALRTNTETDVATFTLSTSSVAAITATDVLAIQNPSAGTSLFRVQMAEVSHTTAGAILQYYVILRTAFNSGGTFTTPGVVSFDSADPVTSAATTRLYTVNPAALGAGAPVGAAVLNPGQPWAWRFGGGGKPLIIRPGQCIAINMNGSNAAAAGMVATIRWTEILST